MYSVAYKEFRIPLRRRGPHRNLDPPRVSWVTCGVRETKADGDGGNLVVVHFEGQNGGTMYYESALRPFNPLLENQETSQPSE